MPAIRVVLVNSYGNRNLGSIARVIKNFGLNELYLVQTRCEPSSEEARRMAVHAQEILENARCVSSLEEALEGCTRVIATTAQVRKNHEISENREKALHWMSHAPHQGAVLFGAEDRGLSNEELSWAQHWISLPGHKEYPTFNLAQAVGITLYELQRQSLRTECAEFSSSPPSLTGSSETSLEQASEEVTLPEYQAGLEHLSSMLLQIGYLHPHTQKKRMEKLRKIFYRAAPNPNELALLRGIFSQMDWALNQK